MLVGICCVWNGTHGVLWQWVKRKEYMISLELLLPIKEFPVKTQYNKVQSSVPMVVEVLFLNIGGWGHFNDCAD